MDPAVFLQDLCQSHAVAAATSLDPAEALIETVSAEYAASLIPSPAHQFSVDLWLPIVAMGMLCVMAMRARGRRRVGLGVGAGLALILSVNGFLVFGYVSSLADQPAPGPMEAMRTRHERLKKLDTGASRWWFGAISGPVRRWMGAAPSPLHAAANRLQGTHAAHTVVWLLEVGRVDQLAEVPDWFPPSDEWWRFDGIAHQTLAASGGPESRVHWLALDFVAPTNETLTGRCGATIQEVAELAAAGHPQALSRWAEQDPRCAQSTRDTAIIESLVGRVEAKFGNYDAAIHRLEAAWVEANRVPDRPALTACVLSRVRAARGLRWLNLERPAEAVADLRRAMTLDPAVHGARNALVLALYEEAERLLRHEPWATRAADVLEEALDLGAVGMEVEVAELFQVVALAAGSQALEAEQFEGALHYLRRAHGVASSPTVARHLARALEEAAEAHQLRETFAEAAVLLDEAAALGPDVTPTAGAARAAAEGATERLAMLRSAPAWLEVPTVRGEVARDTDGDGLPDHYFYFAPDSPTVRVTAAIVGGRVQQWQVVDEEGRPQKILRDFQGDGRLDEAIEIDGRGTKVLARIDSDGDGGLDHVVRRVGDLIEESTLSGRIALTVQSGAVNADMDFWSRPDTYLVLSKNGSVFMKTPTAEDSNFPIWNRGVVVDYRFGDRVRLQAYDEDTFNADEFIDQYTFGELPRSGVYRFDQGKLAVSIAVEASRLPEGYEVAGPAIATNPIEAHPERYLEVVDISLGARRIDRTKRRREVFVFLATELVVGRVLPRAATLLGRLGRLAGNASSFLAAPIAQAITGGVDTAKLAACMRDRLVGVGATRVAEHLTKDPSGRLAIATVIEDLPKGEGAAKVLGNVTWKGSQGTLAARWPQALPLLASADLARCLLE